VNPAEWTATATQISSIGFAVWYAWWTTTHTIPRMQEKHDDTIYKLVSEFRSDVKEQRSDFLEKLSIVVDANAKMTDAVNRLNLSINGLSGNEDVE